MAELESLTVSAPATSANLGPGFDCLAVALDLGNAVVVSRRPGPLSVRVVGEGAGELAEDASNLVCRALASGLGSLDGLAVECRNRIPLGAGPGLVVGRRLLRPGGGERPGRPALDARRPAGPGRRDRGPRRQLRRLPHGRAGGRGPGAQRAAGGGPRRPRLRGRHPRLPHLHRQRPPGPARDGPAGRCRGHAGQRRGPHAGPGGGAPGRPAPAAGRPPARAAPRGRGAGAGGHARPGRRRRLPGATISGSGPSILLWCRAGASARLEAAATAALAADGVAAKVRPSRPSSAGVRARWTGGSDLRLARAVG